MEKSLTLILNNQFLQQRLYAKEEYGNMWIIFLITVSNMGNMQSPKVILLPISLSRK